MKPRLSNSSLTVHLTPPGCADPAAPLPSASGDGAAFCHYTESAPVIVGVDMASGPDMQMTFLRISDQSTILLHAIVAYEQCSPEKALALALATHVAKIGCGPLARAVLDQLERQDSAPRDSGDLTDVPVFDRTASNRFHRKDI